MPAQPVLSVDGLSVKFAHRDGEAVAVSNLDFTIAAGETLAVVGSSDAANH